MATLLCYSFLTFLVEEGASTFGLGLTSFLLCTAIFGD